MVIPNLFVQVHACWHTHRWGGGYCTFIPRSMQWQWQRSVVHITQVAVLVLTLLFLMFSCATGWSLKKQTMPGMWNKTGKLVLEKAGHIMHSQIQVFSQQQAFQFSLSFNWSFFFFFFLTWCLNMSERN